MADSNIEFHIGVTGAAQARKEMEAFENGMKKAILEANAAFAMQEKEMKDTLDMIHKYKQNMANVREIQQFNKQVANGGVALRDFGRIAEDAGYGLYAIQNNIVPALYSFQQLRTETGSNVAAFKALLSSLTGMNGLIFAYQLISSGFIMYTNHARTAREETDKLAESASKAVNKLLEVADPFKNYKYIFKSIEEAQGGIKNLRLALEQQVGGFEGQIKTRMGPGSSPYSPTGTSNTYTYTKKELLGMITYDKEGKASIDQKLLDAFETDRARKQFSLLANTIGSLIIKLKGMQDEGYIANLLGMSGAPKIFTGDKSYAQKMWEEWSKKTFSMEMLKGWSRGPLDTSDNQKIRNDVWLAQLLSGQSSTNDLWGKNYTYKKFAPPDSMGLINAPKAPDMKEFKVTDKDMKETFGVYYDFASSFADTFKSELNGAWEGIFGHANSLAEKFLQNLASRMGSRLIDKAANGILSLIPGYDAVSGNRQAASQIGKLAAERY
jgi:hypothetical protein